MELKKGYKQTEIGVIPEDWKIKFLVDLTNLLTKQTGFDYSAHIKPALETNRTSQNIPFIQNKDFDGHKINYDTDYFIPKSVAIKFPKILLDEKCLLISISGSIGNVAVFDNTQLAFIGGAVAIAKFKDKSILNWVMYYLLSPVGRKAIFNNVKSGSHQNLTLEDIRKLYVPIPNIEEQRAIANALSNADAYIASLEKLIEKKRQIKQGAMQELLMPKDGWVNKKLSDVILNFQNGYGFSATGYVKTGTPIVTMAQIGLDGSFNFNNSKVNKWNVSDFDLLKNFHLKNGDLIIAMTDVTPEKNLIGRMAIVKTQQTLLLNQRVGLLRLDSNKVNPFFLKTLSNMPTWRSYCIGVASLGVQANIGTKDIMNGIITLPDIIEQNETAKILDEMDQEISLSKIKLQKAKSIKQGMMQSLLTGKIRLI